MSRASISRLSANGRRRSGRTGDTDTMRSATTSWAGISRTSVWGRCGFGLFTIRNGNLAMPDKYPKSYAEKLLAMYPGQTAAIHYHVAKMEDIINRGGNDVFIQVWNGTKDLKMLDTDVDVYTDGCHSAEPAEVSKCNDDDHDNYWYDRSIGRFPAIDEDEKPYRLLCTEYPKARD